MSDVLAMAVLIRLESECIAKDKRIAELEELLSEAVDLMEDVRTGDYTPDSFTTQPWKKALEVDQDG